MDVKILAMYLGCECTEAGLSGRGNTLVAVSFDGYEESTVRTPQGSILQIRTTKIKPILRRLSSMTEEDYQEACKYGLGGASTKDLWLGQFEKFEERPIEGQGKKHNVENPVMKKVQVEKGLKLIHYTFAPQVFLYLLSKHFDLFGLLDSGDAIEKE